MKYQIDGVTYEIDSSDLDKYRDPRTGELNFDIFAEDVADAVANANMGQPTGMSDEDAAAFDEASDILDATGKWIRPGGSGAWLRTVAAGALPFTSEAEAAARSMFGDETYSEALDAARQSRDDYAAAYPVKSLGLTIAGGLLPSLVTFGAASPLSAVRTATTAARMGRGTLTGLGLGTLYGFGNSRGGFENRLGDALLGGASGAVVGGLTPAVASGLRDVGNEIGAFRKGLGKYRLSAPEVESFMVNKALPNTTTAGKYADILATGAKYGAEDISDAGVNLQNLYKTAFKQDVPELYTGTTPGGTKIGDILSKAETPGYNTQNKAFQTFVGNNPQTTEGGIAAASQFLKRNPVANKIIKQLKMEDVDPDTFKWWQNVEQGLTNKLPKKYDVSKLKPAQKKTYNAIQDISAERDRLFPGVQKTNVNMASGIAEKEMAADVIAQRLNTMAQRPTQEKGLGSGLFGFITKRTDPIMSRGRARQLIQSGESYGGISDKSSRRASEITDSVLRALVSW